MQRLLFTNTISRARLSFRLIFCSTLDYKALQIKYVLTKWYTHILFLSIPVCSNIWAIQVKTKCESLNERTSNTNDSNVMTRGTYSYSIKLLISLNYSETLTVIWAHSRWNLTRNRTQHLDNDSCFQIQQIWININNELAANLRIENWISTF